MSDRLKVVAIIPARFASTRFPGKPLALIVGRPMIQHVYERVREAKSVGELYVATDDERIARAVESFGGKYIMTSSSLQSGTDRCAEAAEKIESDIVVNIQGDEPLISATTVDAVVDAMTESKDCLMSTAAVPMTDHELLRSENVVKVVLNKNSDALYFSRSVIPFVRDANKGGSLSRFKLLKHLGIYAYRTDFLRKLTLMKPTALELAEKLEQLRVLENGYRIRVAVTDHDTVSVDVPADIPAVEELLSNQ